MRMIISIFFSLIIFISINSTGFTQSASSISQANNQFAFDLYSRIDSNKGNIFFSPYSLSSALEMTYEGARGETAQQIRAVLHLRADDAARRAETSAFIQQMNSPDKNYELTVANALWAQKMYPFKDGYLKLVQSTYFAEARNLDFKSDPEGSRSTINSWVSEKTKNRINDLIPPRGITPATRFVLADAVYFKGKWVAAFEKENTKLDTFWLTPDQSVQTDMMSLSGESFFYNENDQAQILELPYKGNELTMLIILPRSKEVQGLEKILTQDIFKQWQEGMRIQEVNVVLPKFKFDSFYEMNNFLDEMGMKLAFDRAKADFSGMANITLGENLFINIVLHKAWIETNEEGTEAAAATVVIGGATMTAVMFNPQPPKIFRADHPFIFLIQDNKTGHILFMGRVSDPRDKS